MLGILRHVHLEEEELLCELHDKSLSVHHKEEVLVAVIQELT